MNSDSEGEPDTEKAKKGKKKKILMNPDSEGEPDTEEEDEVDISPVGNVPKPPIPPWQFILSPTVKEIPHSDECECFCCNPLYYYKDTTCNWPSCFGNSVE